MRRLTIWTGYFLLALGLLLLTPLADLLPARESATPVPGVYQVLGPRDYSLYVVLLTIIGLVLIVAGSFYRRRYDD